MAQDWSSGRLATGDWRLATGAQMQGRVQFSELINASVLLFGRTIKYCVTNMARRSQNRARKFPTSLSTLSYKNSRVSY